MKIKHVNNINELPRNTLMVLYHAPFFKMVKEDEQTEEEHGLTCSIYEYRAKYGEPKTIYIYNKNLYFIKEE